MNNQRRIFQPVKYAALLALGLYMGSTINFSGFRSPGNLIFKSSNSQFSKFNDVVAYIKQEYVDSIDQKNLIDKSIEDLLHNLDPHSAYIPAEDLQAVNEPLEGNFEGIGIEFHIQYDTIMVVTTIAGGPSEAIGLKPGDRLIEVDGKKVAGVKITNEDVFKKLRGPGGTKVNLKVLRRGMNKLLNFTITRGRIPIKSLDASFMINETTGYIKISRFAATTMGEYKEAFEKLRSSNLKNLILDLRGNPGGYLDAASEMADEFLPAKKLIVYTEGRARAKTEYYATSKGSFETGKLVVLIDEGSASASEIVAGAVQDWDRATIVGRRSFGKGLVQEQTVFPDGSAMRLTVARYYTPTGRCIQKSYSEGIDKYNDELDERLKHGEFENADSIKFADSLKFKTPGGKIVYGGGGIMPDVFIPVDTTADNDFSRAVFGQQSVTQFSYDYVDKNRMLFKAYPDFSAFNRKFFIDENLFRQFVSYSVKKGAKEEPKQIEAAKELIKTQIKAYIARQVYGNDGFYRVLLADDNAFEKAVELIEK